VLQGQPDAPRDLRERALLLAGEVLEMAGRAAPGTGLALAARTLDTGRALSKFIAICEAQGGLREPPRALFREAVLAGAAGRVGAIDNRRLARAAKLAGAPHDPAAGAAMHVRLGDSVGAGQPLFTLHAQSAGELAYALAYLGTQAPIIDIDSP
jgi:thymidine phosphorylase